jgi:hypothetical protein
MARKHIQEDSFDSSELKQIASKLDKVCDKTLKAALSYADIDVDTSYWRSDVKDSKITLPHADKEALLYEGCSYFWFESLRGVVTEATFEGDGFYDEFDFDDKYFRFESRFNKALDRMIEPYVLSDWREDAQNSQYENFVNEVYPDDYSGGFVPHDIEVEDYSWGDDIDISFIDPRIFFTIVSPEYSDELQGKYGIVVHAQVGVNLEKGDVPRRKSTDDCVVAKNSPILVPWDIDDEGSMLDAVSEAISELIKDLIPS